MSRVPARPRCALRVLSAQPRPELTAVRADIDLYLAHPDSLRLAGLAANAIKDLSSAVATASSCANPPSDCPQTHRPATQWTVASGEPQRRARGGPDVERNINLRRVTVS